MPAYVYILESDRGMFYIGSSEDPIARYHRHLSGWVHTTARMKNLKLVFTQEYPDIKTAKKIKLKLKKLKRKDYIKGIIKDGFIKIKP